MAKGPAVAVETGASAEGLQQASILVERTLDDALSAAEDVAELWGGAWTRRGTEGDFELPVAAGVRRGVVAGVLRAVAENHKTRLTAQIERADYQLQSREVMVLLMGAAGGLFLVVAPFVPELFDLIPMAGLLLLLAWFLVVSRLRNRSIEDFLAEIAAPPESTEP